MDTDEHRFCGLGFGLCLVRFRFLSGERVPAVQKRGNGLSSSVSFCVHLESAKQSLAGSS